MRRLFISAVFGLAIQATAWLAIRGHFGPCGPTDAVGMATLVSQLPGVWLVDLFHLSGSTETVALFVAPAGFYTATIWIILSGVCLLKRRRVVEQG